MEAFKKAFVVTWAFWAWSYFWKQQNHRYNNKQIFRYKALNREEWIFNNKSSMNILSMSKALESKQLKNGNSLLSLTHNRCACCKQTMNCKFGSIWIIVVYVRGNLCAFFIHIDSPQLSHPNSPVSDARFDKTQNKEKINKCRVLSFKNTFPLKA